MALQAWNTAKAMGVRPSELFGVTWPLAAFLLDRGLYRWSTFVENKLNEVELTVRNQMKNSSGADVFVQSARTSMYNKLMGLDPASAYRSPGVFADKPKKVATQAVSAEGKLDLTVFNG